MAFLLDRFPVLSETFVVHQVAGLVRLGHEVTVLSLHAEDTGIRHHLCEKYRLEERVRKAVRASAARDVLIQLLRIATQSLWSSAARRRCAAAIRATLSRNWSAVPDLLAYRPVSGDYDVVIAHFGTLGVRAMALREAGLVSGRLITVFHGFDMSVHRLLRRHIPLYKRLLRTTEQQLPISKLWAERLLSWGGDPEKIRVLHMGVDVESLPALPDRPLGSPLQVLCVGRFTQKKAQADVIRAVLACRCDLRLDLIGGGEMESQLRALAGDDARIRFLGKRTQQEVFAALAAADVFMLPSVTAANGDMEGIPVALMEAMAMGVLVLSTRHSGIPELIEHERSGFLVAEHDVAGMAAILESLAAGLHDVSALRRAARARVLAEFDNGKLDLELERICARLCAQR
ncbi:MAG: glycosyltransferase [Steroidobacteraceae bacterium]